MFSFLYHVWFLGHSVTVNKLVSVKMFDTARGWLYKCECGEVWAR